MLKVEVGVNLKCENNGNKDGEVINVTLFKSSVTHLRLFNGLLEVIYISLDWSDDHVFEFKTKYKPTFEVGIIYAAFSPIPKIQQPMRTT